MCKPFKNRKSEIFRFDTENKFVEYEDVFGIKQRLRANTYNPKKTSNIQVVTNPETGEKIVWSGLGLNGGVIWTILTSISRGAAAVGTLGATEFFGVGKEISRIGREIDNAVGQVIEETTGINTGTNPLKEKHCEFIAGVTGALIGPKIVGSKKMLK